MTVGSPTARQQGVTARDVGDESPAARLRRAALGVVAVLAVYYAVPVGRLPSGAGVAFSVVGVVGGAVLLVWLAVRQLQLLAAGERTDGTVRLDGLVLLVVVVVPLFAVGYLVLEKADSDQFASLSTKTDALYFSLSTLATVGFGDVHATGQLARGLVTLQIAFDLVFVGALVSVVTGQIRARSARRTGQPPDPTAM